MLKIAENLKLKTVTRLEHSVENTQVVKNLFSFCKVPLRYKSRLATFGMQEKNLRN